MAKEYLKVRSGVGLKPNTVPSDPENGDYYYDSGTNEFKFRQGGIWVSLGGSGGVSIYANFAALPGSATDGTPAITSDTSTFYIYDTGTTSWLAVGNPSTVFSVGTINSQTKSANGAVIANNEIVLQTADATNPGLVSTGAQTFAGNKTLSGTTNLSALTASLPLKLNASKNIISAAITNADVDGAAGITYAKLNLSNSIQNSDIVNGTIQYAKLSLANSIMGSDINGGANIARFKLSALTANRALISDGSGYDTVSATTSTELGYLSGVTSAIQTQLNGKQASGSYITDLTGDIAGTGPGSTSTTIQSNVVSNSKLAQMPANTIKGNNTGGAANAADLTIAQVQTMLGIGGASTAAVWTKYTLSHTDFQTAGTTNNITLFSLPAQAMLHQVVIKHSTAFAGTGVTGYTLSVGVAGNVTKHSAPFNTFQAVSNAARSTTQIEDFESFTGATNITINATSTGANLSTSTAGSVDIWVLVSTLP